jgi:hypothetical protein
MKTILVASKPGQTKLPWAFSTHVSWEDFALHLTVARREQTSHSPAETLQGAIQRSGCRQVDPRQIIGGHRRWSGDAGKEFAHMPGLPFWQTDHGQSAPVHLPPRRNCGGAAG